MSFKHGPIHLRSELCSEEMIYATPFGGRCLDSGFLLAPASRSIQGPDGFKREKHRADRYFSSSFLDFFLQDFKGIKILNTSTKNLIMKTWRSKDTWPDKSSRSADHIGNILYSQWLTDLRHWSGLDSFLLVLLLNWVHSKTKTLRAEFTHSTKLGRLAHPPSSMFTSLQVLRRCWIDPI